jgi:proline dehydrogenase
VSTPFRRLFLALSRSRRLRDASLRHPVLRRAARRFIAGEQLDEALEATRRLNERGLSTTLDLLGEDVTTAAQAEASAEAYLRIVDALRVPPAASTDYAQTSSRLPTADPRGAAGVANEPEWPEAPAPRTAASVEGAASPGGAADRPDNNLSLKLTQLGLDVDAVLCGRVLRRILDRAAEGPAAGGEPMFVRIDMESSAHTDVTLRLFEALWTEGRRNVGVVIQAYLRRSPQDVAKLNGLGARVRLCKGAYDEPPSVAFPDKRDVDRAFAQLTETLLRGGTYPAIATHDERLIDHARRTARAAGIGPERFEFQMLHGIRRDLQTRLRREGYRVRVYVPFGEEWYPYFMRRLAERPANVAFVLRSLLQERAAG